MPGSDLPDKLFFKIGEVAQIVGVRAHVLRYWESEFPALRPLKTRGAHRVYRRRDVELAVLLRRLLHEEGLTIVGAKRRLRETGQHRVAREPVPSVVREVSARAELLALREQLSSLLDGMQTIIDGPMAAEQPTDVHATVTASVPNSVPVQAVRRPPA
ncbi:MAG: MerR family transcriptional regulator [Polyangiales bacterium]